MKLLIGSDFHLREDTPICRDPAIWVPLQRKAVRFFFQTAKERKVDRAGVTGDTFHRSHVHPKMLSMFLAELLDSGMDLSELAGNHDVPYHVIEDQEASTFGNLWWLTKVPGSPVKTFDDIGAWYHFSELGKMKDQTGRDPSIVFLHELTFASERSRAIVNMHEGDAFVADDLFDLLPAAQFIFTGDNHQHFAVQKGKRWVINPGCLLRQDADEIDGESGFYFVDTTLGKVEFIPVPDDELVDNSHLIAEKARDERVEAFIASLESNAEVSLDFLFNLEVARRANKSELGTADKIIDELLMEAKV
jgi:DNA repair exonuclease SbcCD nuclease subunit